MKWKRQAMNTGPLKIPSRSVLFGAALALTASGAVAQEGGSGSAKAGGVSIWSGVYTAAQGKRGAELYSGACAHCHGLKLNGAAQPDQPPSPAIARVGFLRKWAGKPVAELFVYVHTKMPPDNPGSLSEQQAIDAVAHMFAVSSIPPGDKEMPPDSKALAGLVIEAQAK
jgi:mono/diheme cytochrome c family protein